MMYLKEEILKALKVIQHTCKEQDHGGIVDCLSCPLADEGRHCIINEQVPLAWDIKNEVGIWRAFE